MKILEFFLARCVRTAVKTIVVVDRKKKQQNTSCAIFGVETAAKCCELNRCADRVPNRTDKANLNFSPELYRRIFFCLNWTFRLPPKRQLSILLNFFAINKFVFEFCCVCLFCYNAGHHAISRQKQGIQHRVRSSVCHFILVTLCCGWTDGRSRDCYVTTKISWLHRLPNFLSNGAPLTP